MGTIPEWVLTVGGWGSAAGAGVWGWLMHRKSNRANKAEEDDAFIDSAVKITKVWEALSANYMSELRELKAEYREIDTKYNQLRIDFEVLKAKGEMMLEQKNTEISKLSLDIAHKDAKIHQLEIENKELKKELGTGVVRTMGGK